MLKLQEFHSRIATRLLFSGTELVLQAGMLTVVTGPSGSGKSRFLGQLCGLYPGLTGHLLVDGREIVPPLYERIPMGMVFQEHGLIDQLTVQENLQLADWPHHSASEEQIREALDWFRLTDVADHHPEALSEGMKKRVSLIRAGLQNPRLVLLDEPLSGLEEAMRRRVVDWWELWLQQGVAVLVTTHLNDELADRRLVHYAIEDNRLIRQDDAKGAVETAPMGDHH